MPVLDMVGELVQRLALLLQVPGVHRIALGGATPHRRGCLLATHHLHRLCQTLSLAAAPPPVGATMPCSRSERQEELSANARLHSPRRGLALPVLDPRAG
jgi:hypothetical protein